MTTLIKASCYCGLNTFGIPLNANQSSILCHCSSCRHSTGQLMAHVVQLDGAPLTPSGDQPADLSNLTTYKSSPVMTRRFCSRCSCHILWEFNDTETPRWYITTGTLEQAQGAGKIGCHIFITDTQDGGITNYLEKIDGSELPRYAQSPREGEMVPKGWRGIRTTESTNAGGQTYLSAYCRCKAVSLWITRPSSDSSNLSSPYPDLTHPWKSSSETIKANPNDEKWWLRPASAAHPTRYLAGHCACATCRLTSGFEIQSWAFIPRFNIFFRRSGLPALESGATPEKDELVSLDLRKDDTRPVALKTYRSNTGRMREFCSTCGATVFWSGDERPDLIDLSVGLLDESTVGARAEGWLDWHKGRVSFEEDAVNKPLVQALAEGLRF